MQINWKKEAGELAEVDPLKHYKNEFYFPEECRVYLDGNSLGLLSTRAEASVLAVLEEWKHKGIDGWMKAEDPWFYFAQDLAKKSSSLVGALPHEVTTAGSITANLHQMLATFYQPNSQKKNIVMEEIAFPTDRYVVDSHLKLHGYGNSELVTVQSSGSLLCTDDILAAIDDNTALVLLPSILYRSGQRLEWKVITDHAHAHGALIGWDLAHSFGVMPHDLHDAGIDFAVWCTYKYANSGPGGAGGLFVHEKHHDRIPGLAGWFGSHQEKQFDMDSLFTPAQDASAYQQGTPPILSMAPLKGSLEMLEEAGIDRIRSRSLQLTGFLMKGLHELSADDSSLEVVTPEGNRGGHVAVSHPEAAKICKALKDQGIIPDFRAPDIIRLAPSPLYTSFEDVYESLVTIKEVLEKKDYKKYDNKRDIIA